MISQGSREPEQVCSLIKAFAACIHTVKPVLVANCIKQAYNYSVPSKCEYIEKYLYFANTCFKQAHFDYPLGACLMQVGLYMFKEMKLQTKTKRTRHLTLPTSVFC